MQLRLVLNVSNNALFQFEAGQYITIKQDINGEEVRRAYSICSMNAEGVTIGVKKVETGRMSTFLTESVKKGDVLQCYATIRKFCNKRG